DRGALRDAKRHAAPTVSQKAERIRHRRTDEHHRDQESRTLTEQAHRKWQERMRQQKAEVNKYNSQLGAVTQRSHEAELKRNQAQLKLEQAAESAMEQLTMTPEQLLAVELPEEFDQATARKE